jgi:hypothetical protein
LVTPVFQDGDCVCNWHVTLAILAESPTVRAVEIAPLGENHLAALHGRRSTEILTAFVGQRVESNVLKFHLGAFTW